MPLKEQGIGNARSGAKGLDYAIWALVGGLALSACGADEPMETGSDGVPEDADTGDAPQPEPEPEPEPSEVQTVPADVAPLSLEAQCFDVEGLPSQLSVAPEGALWLRRDDRTWRVIDPFGNDEVQVLSAGVEALQAWSEDRAFVIEDGELLDVQAEWAQPLAWPGGLADPTLMCGDPSSDANGFVIADGLLHRDGGQWWEWTSPSGERWSDVAWMARSAGTCIGMDGGLWLAESSGEVWWISGDLAARVEELDGAAEAVLVDGVGAAALLDGELVAGERGYLSRFRFESGEVSALSSGGEALWVVAGDTVYRWLDGEFTAAMLEGDPVAAGHLWADSAGGVWTVTDEQACHLRPSPPVRVEGVHDLQRLASETIDVAVRLHAGASLVSAQLDGEPLAMESEGSGRYRAETQTIAEGWHTLEVFSSDDEDATHARRVRFEQRRVGDLTWAGNVEPLFEEHCSGGACHGPDLSDTTRPDLSTWDAWIEREDSILERVVSRGDMPPAAVRKESWGLEEQLMVSGWFETGAQQGDEG